jgi:cytochrome P450
MINANKRVDNEEQEEDCDNHKRLYGQSDHTNGTDSSNNICKTEITEEDILATSFLFFVAGFDTTASLLSFLFYTLAIEPDIQQKLYEEVLSYSGNFDYDSIAKMPYLEGCIAETLRLYNPVAALSRIASEDYKLG